MLELAGQSVAPGGQGILPRAKVPVFPPSTVGIWFSGRRWVRAGLGPGPSIDIWITGSQRAGNWCAVRGLLDYRGKHVIL